MKVCHPGVTSTCTCERKVLLTQGTFGTVINLQLSIGTVINRAGAHARDFFIDNLLVRIHFIIVMIRRTGHACSGSEAGSYLRLIDFCVSLNSRLESNKEEERETSKVVTSRGSSWRAREFFIDNLLVRIHFVIVMIRWIGLAPLAARAGARRRLLRSARSGGRGCRPAS